MDYEKDIAQKLSLLRKIEPRNSWVLFAKTQILADSKLITADDRIGRLLNQVKQSLPNLSYLRYLEKPAYLFAVLAFVVLGGVGYNLSQNSLPGDAMYSVRSVLERATTGSDAMASLGVAQRRLEDLRKVVEGNKVKNLSSATEEFNQSVTEVSRNLLALVENEPAKALQVSRELVQLQKDKAQMEQLLGVAFGGQESSELQNTTKILVEAELNDLLERTLQDEQKELLEQAIVAYQNNDYEKALENVWMISN